MTNPRTAELERTTNETSIRLRLTLDGSGKAEIHTPVGFLNQSHSLARSMLETLTDLFLHVRKVKMLLAMSFCSVMNLIVLWITTSSPIR